ncbi:FtsW/RodA/SpoVE family cell cycle protein [Sediminivirga luteola]|uniref:FtsW/RodA/SpoVE family cell cycle protein n=1 Tax=Sediminivirga luteola TaxID=1774748 RepID=UPI001F5A26E8|nr:putative peptidoglycan glycosyltransferase FtsW [Sediminivirga luteola]MCI2267068.1 putative lipid II flippase FtsW [Sediminivirga luteola]
MMASTREDQDLGAVTAPARGRLRELLDQPIATFWILLAATGALVGIGLMMVLSASSVFDFTQSGSSFGTARGQLIALAATIPLAVVALLLPPAGWRRLAYLVMFVALGSQFLPLVPGLGVSAGGNSGWISLGFTTLQPAEFAKLGLALWLGFVIGHQRQRLSTWKGFLLPVIGFLGMLGVIMISSEDLGTAMIVVLLGLGAFFAAGTPLRMLTGMVSVLAAGVLFFVLTSPNRMHRIQSLLVGADDPAHDPMGTHWQTNHGLFALASGGWTGKGLGASREKWGWLPAAHNDYIFAIIGEELGFIGTLLVVLLFALLAYGMFRLIARSQDMFIKVTTAAVLTWVVGQAAINIGVVANLLPVIGVPLPLVSAGGSALMSTCLALAMVMSFALHEAGGRAALTGYLSRARGAVDISARRARKRESTPS